MELDINTICHRQKLFSSALKSQFLRKITKYQNILLKNGIHLSEDSSTSPGVHDLYQHDQAQCLEDHIELVIGQRSASPNACKTFWKIGNRISTVKLFRWIVRVVQRTKAVRVLLHLDGIPDSEIGSVIHSVGKEIAVAYEYQLCVLEGDQEVIQLAQHAAACIITYLNSVDAHYAPENLLQAVLEVKPQNSNNKEILRTTPITYNNQPVCLRWRISQVLKQPGLRTIRESGAEGTSQKETNVTEGIDDVPGETVVDDVPDIKGIEDVPNSTGIGEASTCIIANCENKNELKSHELQGQVEGFKELFAIVEDICSNTDSDFVEFVKSEFDVNNGINDKADLKLMEKTRRRISTVEMDYEKGMIHVTEHSVEVSDFSPVGKGMSHLEDDDSTSADEDLHSEAELGHGTIGFSDNFLDQVDMHQVDRNGIDLIVEDLTTKMCKPIEIYSAEDSSAKTDAPSNGQGKIHDDDIDVSNRLSIHDKKGAVSNNMCNKNNYNDLQLCNKNDSTDDTIISCIPNNLHELPSNDTDTHIKFSNAIYSNIYCQEQVRENVSDEKLNDVNIDNILPPCVEKSYRFYGCFTPYGAKCRPQIYGYRGPLHVWNERERQYTLIYNDTVTVTRSHQREIPQNTEDCHQSYVPVTVCKH